jgi:murein DD-endopeptidase MepM/ murein hydrolase activator NlpD
MIKRNRKHKYHFDLESLSYHVIEQKLKDKFVKILSQFSLSIVIAILLSIGYLYYFDSPKEKSLEREINQLTAEYELLNKSLDEIQGVLKDVQQRDDNVYRAIFSAEPIPLSVRRAGFGGVNRYERLEGYNNSDIVIETSKRMDVLKKQLYIQTKSFDEVIELAKSKEKMLHCIPAIQPIKNKNLTQVASGWGWRIHPIYKIRKFHYGMDFTAPTGTPIFATGDGVVTETSFSRLGLGNNIVINHGFGFRTVYAHLSRFKAKSGQRVKRGDIIGYVGSTGTSTGPHIHYEVLKDGKNVDPKDYFFKDLTPAEYDRLIELSSNANTALD